MPLHPSSFAVPLRLQIYACCCGPGAHHGLDFGLITATAQVRPIARRQAPFFTPTLHTVPIRARQLTVVLEFPKRAAVLRYCHSLDPCSRLPHFLAQFDGSGNASFEHLPLDMSEKAYSGTATPTSTLAT